MEQTDRYTDSGRERKIKMAMHILRGGGGDIGNRDIEGRTERIET